VKINYHNRTFRGVSNSSGGQVDDATVFNYNQTDNRLTADYHGGKIRMGHLMGLVNPDNSLDFLYHHIDELGNLRNGYCHSIPEILSDGRIRLYEKWKWTFEGTGNGESVVEEI